MSSSESSTTPTPPPERILTSNPTHPIWLAVTPLQYLQSLSLPALRKELSVYNSIRIPTGAAGKEYSRTRVDLLVLILGVLCGVDFGMEGGNHEEEPHVEGLTEASWQGWEKERWEKFRKEAKELLGMGKWDIWGIWEQERGSGGEEGGSEWYPKMGLIWKILEGRFVV
ncbi:hypothetical protein BELL_0720g00030 [Botrytis elliptica]|uniref:Uncharacterized protein n=1 Tax=Botrytis elliptica TaxID=278938 RepID=A0A4Z1J9Z2_9HELO|nr:hypothetical protein EAE99_011601 [Botrytis elliptica]TGO70479.1 hypothetical protein BELL_0720g00030 [Botrytis elliptica]